MMGFTLWSARMLKLLDTRHPETLRYLGQLKARPAFAKASGRAGVRDARSFSVTLNFVGARCQRRARFRSDPIFLTDRVWDMTDVAAHIAAREAPAARRGPYRKRVA